MAKTKTITVGSGAATAITVTSPCSEVVVGEDPSVANWPTTDFFVMKPTSGDVQIRKQSGTSYRFSSSRGFSTGEIAGYVQAVAGSTTFFQDEGGVSE